MLVGSVCVSLAVTVWTRLVVRISTRRTRQKFSRTSARTNYLLYGALVMAGSIVFKWPNTKCWTRHSYCLYWGPVQTIRVAGTRGGVAHVVTMMTSSVPFNVRTHTRSNREFRTNSKSIKWGTKPEKTTAETKSHFRKPRENTLTNKFHGFPNDLHRSYCPPPFPSGVCVGQIFS